MIWHYYPVRKQKIKNLIHSHLLGLLVQNCPTLWLDLFFQQIITTCGSLEKTTSTGHRQIIYVLYFPIALYLFHFVCVCVCVCVISFVFIILQTTWILILRVGLYLFQPASNKLQVRILTYILLKILKWALNMLVRERIYQSKFGPFSLI